MPNHTGHTDRYRTRYRLVYHVLSLRRVYAMKSLRGNTLGQYEGKRFPLHRNFLYRYCSGHTIRETRTPSCEEASHSRGTPSSKRFSSLCLLIVES